MRTIREACIRGTEILRQKGISEAELDAWYLLEHVTGISRALYFSFSVIFSFLAIFLVLQCEFHIFHVF